MQKPVSVEDQSVSRRYESELAASFAFQNDASRLGVRMSSPAIFLDRDGTIIVERNYPSHPDQVELLDAATAGLRALAKHGFPFVVVSNQSGIGRGYFSVDEADAVEARVRELRRRRRHHR